MTDDFFFHLTQMQEKYQSQLTHLETLLITSENRLAEISSILRDLENKRLETNQQIYQTRQTIEEVKFEEQNEILEFVFREFNTFQKNMEICFKQNIEIRENLKYQFDELLIQNPTLRQALDEYHDIYNNAEVVLNSMPSIYRTTLEQTIQKEALRLQPFLEIEAKLKTLPENLDLIVPIVFSIDIIHSQVFLAIPAANPTIMSKLEKAFIQGLSLLAKDSDWTLLEIEHDIWAGFRSLTTLIEYKGQIPLHDAIINQLEQRFIETWPFENLIPYLKIAELDWDTWTIGQSRSGAVLDLIAELPEVETGVPAVEESRQPVEAMSRIFTEKDITAWERPLRVSEESAWTVSARRLRTLMIRFVSQGRIAKNGLSSDQILSGLSKEHKESFEKHIVKLIELGIFHQKEVNGISTYSLNPNNLGNVQDLINRDITPFWISISS